MTAPKRTKKTRVALSVKKQTLKDLDPGARSKDVKGGAYTGGVGGDQSRANGGCQSYVQTC